MERKYTKGPWKVLPEEVDKPYIRIRGTQLGGRYKISNVLTPVYDGVSEREAVETRGNARLIAAAPESIEQLIESNRHLVLAIGLNHPLVVKNRKIIAKALGETE